MILGCYDLRLYCDSGAHPAWEMEDKACGEFTEQTRNAGIRAARRLGWVVNWKSGRAICPHCSRRRKPR